MSDPSKPVDSTRDLADRLLAQVPEAEYQLFLILQRRGQDDRVTTATNMDTRNVARMLASFLQQVVQVITEPPSNGKFDA